MLSARCVDHLRGMTLMAVVVSQQRICPVSMIHLYRICMQTYVATAIAIASGRLHMRLTTPPPSPLLSVLVDCLVLAVVIWDTMFASHVSLMLRRAHCVDLCRPVGVAERQN